MKDDLLLGIINTGTLVAFILFVNYVLEVIDRI